MTTRSQSPSEVAANLAPFRPHVGAVIPSTPGGCPPPSPPGETFDGKADMTSYLSEANAARLDGLIHTLVFEHTGKLDSPTYYSLCRQVRHLLELELASAGCESLPLAKAPVEDSR